MAFAKRGEVDRGLLEAGAANLLDTVNRLVQPTDASVWIKP